jgi:hypothetical protein
MSPGPALGGVGRGGRPGPPDPRGPKSQLGSYTCFMCGGDAIRAGRRRISLYSYNIDEALCTKVVGKDLGPLFVFVRWALFIWLAYDILPFRHEQRLIAGAMARPWLEPQPTHLPAQ